jgi:hypothetical protein
MLPILMLVNPSAVKSSEGLIFFCNPRASFNLSIENGLRHHPF